MLYLNEIEPICPDHMYRERFHLVEIGSKEAIAARRRTYSAACIAERIAVRKISIGASWPSRSTCQKIQPLHAGRPCAKAPILWIEPMMAVP